MILIAMIIIKTVKEKYILYDPRRKKRVKINKDEMYDFCNNKVRVCKKTFFDKGRDNPRFRRYCRTYKPKCKRAKFFEEYCKNKNNIGSVKRNCKNTKWESVNAQNVNTKIQVVYIIPGDLNRNEYNNDTNGKIHNMMLKVQKNAIKQGDFKFDITDELWTISNNGLEKRNWDSNKYKTIDKNYKFMKCADEMILIEKMGDQTVKMYGRYLVNMKPGNAEKSKCEFKYDKDKHTDIQVKKYKNHPFQQDNVFYLLIVEDGSANNCFTAQYMPSEGFYGVGTFKYKFALFTLGRSARLEDDEYIIDGKNCSEYKGRSVNDDKFEQITGKITHELMHMTANTDHKNLNATENIYETDVLYSGRGVKFNDPTFGSYIKNKRNKGMLSQEIYNDNIELLPKLSVNKFKNIYENFKYERYSL